MKKKIKTGLKPVASVGIKKLTEDQINSLGIDQGIKYRDMAFPEISRLTMGEEEGLKAGAYRNRIPIAIFSTMRSGSTLLMRMIQQACGIQMVGERGADFFNGAALMYRQITEAKSQFGKPLENYIKQETLPHDYDPVTREQRLRGLISHVTSYLSPQGVSTFLPRFKTVEFCVGTYGVSDGLFMHLLRKQIFEDEKVMFHAQKPIIIWLTRDTGEIIDSVRRCEHIYTNRTEHNQIIQFGDGLINDQKKRFDKLKAEGDFEIDYHQLIKKPKTTLKRLGLPFSEKLLSYVMDMRLR